MRSGTSRSMEPRWRFVQLCEPECRSPYWIFGLCYTASNPVDCRAAYFRQWFRLAVTGVILAYATFVIRDDAPGQLARWALWIQWLAFEVFDLLDIMDAGVFNAASSVRYFC